MAKRIFLLLSSLLPVLGLCLAFSTGAVAAQFETLHPGIKTIGIWLPDANVRLNVNVWYPSVRKATLVNYNPWKIIAARNGKEAVGRFPLLLLSHDSSGERFSHHSLAALLARSGFVVVAPTHHGDNTNNMQNLFSLQQLTQRVAQLKTTLDTVLQHPETMHSIDPDRIGILGFGTGGTAALLMGGALLSKDGWADYCAKAGSADSYCAPWAAGRMNTLVQGLPLKASLADQRIKAVAAIAPAYGMLFTKQSLQYFYPPLLLVRAENDSVNRSPWHVDALRGLFAKVPQFYVLPGADAASLTAPCPPAFQRDLPEQCNSVSPAERTTIHSHLERVVSKFFLQILGDRTNLPTIPPPPDLTPAPAVRAPAPAASPSASGGGKRPSRANPKSTR